MSGNRKILNTVSIFAGLAILSPMLLIVIWSFANRWMWPGLLPQNFSLRGINELTGSHTQALPVLASSILFSLIAAILATIIGFMAARAFSFYDFYGKSGLRFASMLPIIIPANVFAMGIHVLFIRLGLNDTIAGVLICHVIYSLPYAVHLLTGMMNELSDSLEWQARVLGASPGRAFLAVTLPLSLPAVLASLSMAYIISFSQYFLTLLIGGGRIKTFSVLIVPFITGGDRTIAGAYVLLFLLSCLLTFAIFEALSKKLTKRAYSK